MSRKLCLIFDSAPRYREEIYQKIEAAYDCDWYIGRISTDIKEMNLFSLSRVKRYEILGNYERMYWQSGLIRLLFDSRYETYLIGAETRAISKWLFFLLASMFRPRKKIYVWTHGYYGKETEREMRIKNWIYRHVSGTFVYGEHARNLMKAQGLDCSKVFVIRNSLHYTQQKQLRESARATTVYSSHFHNNCPTLSFIGRLTEVKRLDLLIDAVALLRKQGEYYNVVFIGDGIKKKDLEDQARVLGLTGNVWFYGACFDEKKNAELIYNSDLCVAPGNVGLTAIHALMFGCPVISHDDFSMQMPEFEVIKPGLTGDFFEKGNAGSLSVAIQQWFQLHRKDRQSVKEACFGEIDSYWNPEYQINLIQRVVRCE